MRTLLKYVLPVLFAALLSGCGASLVRKVRIGEEVAVRQYGTVGLDLTFEVENASRRTLRLEEAELEFFTGAGSLGRAVLRGSVEVPGRSRGPVCSRWKFDFPDAAAGMVLRKRLEEGDYARLEVEVRMTLRAGACLLYTSDAADGGRAAPCFFRKDAFFRIFEYLCRR